MFIKKLYKSIHNIEEVYEYEINKYLNGYITNTDTEIITLKTKKDFGLLKIYNNKITISFRGTSGEQFNWKSWLRNLDIFKRDFKKFHDGFNKSKIEMYNTVKRVISENLNKDIYFEGFSAGGCYALIMACKIAEEYGKKVHIITIGSPAVITNEGLKYYKTVSHLIEFYNVSNEGDRIWLLGARLFHNHVGKIVKLKLSFLRKLFGRFNPVLTHCFEVYYDNIIKHYIIFKKTQITITRKN